MKIAIDVSQMCYEGSGVARYTRGLTQALLTTGSSHTFVLYAGTLRQRPFFARLARTAPWDTAEWKIKPVPPVLAGIAFNNLPIPFEYMTGPADLIHTSDWTEPYARAPLVTTVHDLVFKKYPETVHSLIRTTQTLRLERLRKNKTHVIVDSESTKNDLMEIYQIKKERISVVYPGINPIYKPASKTEIDRVKSKYNLPSEYIFSLGTQEPRKNLARLREAAVTLPLPLVLAGKHGWGDKTQTIGYVEEADLPAVYSGASVFAFPSLYEGFGFPILEAMACGTPVVTSNVSSLPELAGDAAILVDPQSVDSIKVGILKALEMKTELQPKGIKQATTFNWDTTAKQVLEVYEKIAHRN